PGIAAPPSGLGTACVAAGADPPGTAAGSWAAAWACAPPAPPEPLPAAGACTPPAPLPAAGACAPLLAAGAPLLTNPITPWAGSGPLNSCALTEKFGSESPPMVSSTPGAYFVTTST